MKSCDAEYYEPKDSMVQQFASTMTSLGKRLAPPAEQTDASIAANQPGAIPSSRGDAGAMSVVKQAAALWAVTRLAFVILTYFAVPFNAQSAHGKYSTRSFSPHTLLAAWNRWDTGWYTNIAIHGYHNALTAAFFPLYPALIHLVVAAIGAGVAVAAAIAISNLATLAAFIGLGLLARHEYGSASASYAIRALAAFPLAFFLTGGYSDSLFIALAIFALLFARQGRWLWAALFAFVASFTRLFGLVLVLPLVWEYGRQHRESGGKLTDLLRPRSLGPALALAVAVPLALAIWAGYLYLRYGDPLKYLNVQRHSWDHYAIPPWQWFQLAVSTLQHLPGWSFLQARTLFDLAPVLIFAVITVLCVRRLPVSFLLYMAGTLFICFTSSVPLNFDPFTGQGRYMLMSAPIFLLLGRWMQRHPALDLFVVSVGFLLQGLFTAFFLRGAWLV